MRLFLNMCGVLVASMVLLTGCAAGNVQSTDHYKITYVNMDKVQPANQSAIFQFQIDNLKSGTPVPHSVDVDFSNADMDHGKNEVTAQENSSGVFEAKTVLPMGGKWLVEVKINNEKVEFPFKATGQMQ